MKEIKEYFYNIWAIRPTMRWCFTDRQNYYRHLRVKYNKKSVLRKIHY